MIFSHLDPDPVINYVREGNAAARDLSRPIDQILADPAYNTNDVTTPEDLAEDILNDAYDFGGLEEVYSIANNIPANAPFAPFIDAAYDKWSDRCLKAYRGFSKATKLADYYA
jgi:hypothetical protein|nr:MAG TPA: hypothetical protein [Caudoviricetes sp.]